MSTDTGLDLDMGMAQQWPTRVRIHLRVEHLQGAPEDGWLTLEAGAADAVTVAPDPCAAPGGEARQLRWQDLPGRTLRLRSLSVVAVALFDSVRMPPRICGLPMYRSATLVLAAEGDERRCTQVQLRPAHQRGGTVHATLLCRHAQDRPWEERSVPLERWDADPLRALLRLAMPPPKSARESVPAARQGPAVEATATLG